MVKKALRSLPCALTSYLTKFARRFFKQEVLQFCERSIVHERRDGNCTFLGKEELHLADKINDKRHVVSLDKFH